MELLGSNIDGSLGCGWTSGGARLHTEDDASEASYHRARLHTEDDASGASYHRAPLHAHLSASSGVPVAVTTKMVRNMPRHISVVEFVTELQQSEFAGFFNFAYVPSGRPAGLKFAFVNFRSPVVAARFAQKWHKSQRFGLRGKSVLTVKNAEVQGFYDNLIHRIVEAQRATSSEGPKSGPPNRGARSTDASTMSALERSASAATPRSPPGTVNDEQSGFAHSAIALLQQEVALIPPLPEAMPTPSFEGRVAGRQALRDIHA